MGQPLISIIVPIFNVESYLDSCILSIANQTYRDLEILLIDDGSTDGSGSIAEAWRNKDARIRVIHKNNGGLSSARNVGLDIALGEYITFVDSDDEIGPEYISRLYEALRNHTADISICSCCFINEKGEAVKTNPEYVIPEGTWTQDMVLDIIGNHKAPTVPFVTAWAKLFNAKLFQSLRYKEGVLHEDEFLAHHLYSHTNIIVSITYKGYRYRQRPTSITGQWSIRRLDLFWAFFDRYLFFRNANRRQNAKNTILHSCLSIKNILEHVSYWENKRAINQAFFASARTCKIGKYYFVIPWSMLKNLLRSVQHKHKTSQSS